MVVITKSTIFFTIFAIIFAVFNCFAIKNVYDFISGLALGGLITSIIINIAYDTTFKVDD